MDNRSIVDIRRKCQYHIMFIPKGNVKEGITRYANIKMLRL